MKSLSNLPNFFISKMILLILLTAVILPLGCKQSEVQEKNKAAEDAAEETVTQDKAVNGEQETHKSDEQMKQESENTPETDETEAAERKKSGSNDKTVVATVNGNPIYEYQLKGRTLNDVTVDEILYIEGLNRGLDQEFADQINDYKKRIITSAVRKEIFNNSPDTKISDEELMEYYKNNQEKYMHLTVKQISVKDEAASKEIQNRVLAGEDFNDIASDYDVKEKMVFVKEFRLPTSSNHLFNKKEIGSISDPQKGIMGYEIMKITQIQRIPFEKTKGALKYNVQSERKAKLLKDYAEKIKEQNNITINILKDQMN